jgi:hypothetical protein
MLDQFARLLSGPLALAATLAGCQMIAPTPTPTPIPTPTVSPGERLLPQAGPRCTDLFAGARPTATPAPGSARGPAVALIQSDFSQLEEKYREGNPPFMPWRQQGLPYQSSVVPTRAQATTTDAVQTLVCVRQTYIRVGFYQPSNTPAVRLDWDVRVVRWPSGEPLAGMTFRGPDPPQDADLKGYGTCTEASKTCATKSGGEPVGNALRWLDELIAR